MDVKRYYDRSLLRLPEDEKERQIQIDKFEKVVEMTEKMFELDTTGFESYEITSEIKSPLREDEPHESVDRELIFENTIHREYGYFKLDKILED